MLTKFVLILLFADGGVSPALQERLTYDSAVFLSSDLAAAIPVAAEALLGPQAKATKCLDQLLSYNVHVSRDGEEITVVFWPTARCGHLKGGGGIVVVDSRKLKALSKRGFE
ncbi:MAG: hypothetical protein JNM17_15350 [Archangium sp.]|nr:hypothetical protein [Archangium sp.]